MLSILLIKFGGGGGIRTLARCDPAAGFQDQSLQPLGYASVPIHYTHKRHFIKQNPHLGGGMFFLGGPCWI